MVKTLQDYNIQFENVLIIDTDNAAYMIKCFKSILHGLLPNAVHVTCLAHILNLVGEAFRKPFDCVNTYIRKFNAQFYNAGSRKGRFVRHIKSKDPAAGMVPNPCATRWNSWFEAVKYHAKYFEHMKEFVRDEMKICGKTAPDSVKYLHDIFSSEAQLQQLQEEIHLIAEICQPIIATLNTFQSRLPIAVSAYESLEELQMYFATIEQTSENVRVKEAATNCQDKLSKYMDGQDCAQPGIAYMKACRIFNPRNCGILPKDPMRFSAIPLMHTVPRAEFDLYMNILDPQFVNTNQDLDSITFWKSI